MSSEVGSGHISIFPVMTGFKSKVSKEVSATAKASGSAFSKGFAGVGQQTGTSLGAAFKRGFSKASQGTADAALSPFKKDVAKATADLSKARNKMADDAGKVRVAEMRLADAIARSGEGSTAAVAAEEKLASARRKLAVDTAQYKAATDSLSSAQSELSKAQSALQVKSGTLGSAVQKTGEMCRSAMDKVKGAATSAFNALPQSVQGGLTKMGGMVKSATSALGPHLSNIASKLGGAMSSAMGMIATGAGNMAKAAVTAFTAVTGMSLGAYANYEQLVGGVDTLFKESSGKVQQYASQAYKTSGLSANAYMEQVTGFSASLLQSLGGDTAKAADYADMAVRDMSDNANKMGTDMTLIQNAYQGFAKQNYTMLDNLKLGYGGTKEEMERLIADANRVKAANGEMADLSIDSFADVSEAIHIIQTDMGITGTTAQEAQSTISGSVGMMKAAWTNWLTEMGKGNADMGALTTQMVDTVATAAGNILPRLGTIAGNLFTTLTTSATNWLNTDLPARLNQFQAWVSANLPTMLQRGMDMLGSVAQGIINNMPQITQSAVTLIGTAAGAIISRLPQMVSGGLQMLAGVAQGFANAVPQLIGQIPDIVSRVWNGFTSQDWPGIGLNIITGIGRGIVSAAGGLVDIAVNAAKDALNAVKGWLGIKSPSRKFRDQVGKMIPAGAAMGIERGKPRLLASAKRMAQDTVSAAKVSFGDMGAPNYRTDAASGGYGGMQQTINFYGKVETPDEVTRALRVQQRHGLAATA